jgi:hypothetical protein
LPSKSINARERSPKPKVFKECKNLWFEKILVEDKPVGFSRTIKIDKMIWHVVF